MTSLTDMYLNVCQYENIIKGVKVSSKLTRATRRWKMPDGHRHQLRCTLGQGVAMPDMLCSDIRLRAGSQDAMVTSLREAWPTVIEVARNVFFYSFADDCGITSDRTPTLRLKVFKRKIYKAIKKLGLSAIVQIELQSVMNHPQGGKGRLLLLNAHAICWGDTTLGRLAKTLKKLNRSRSWSNQFGTKPIVRRRLQYGLGDVLQLGHYIDKLPDSTKNRMPHRNKPGGYLFRDTIAGYRPEFALRVFEGLSHIPLTEAIFGVGEGKLIRKAWKARLTAFHRSRPELDTASVFLPTAAFWRQIRERNGSRLFAEFEVA